MRIERGVDDGVATRVEEGQPQEGSDHLVVERVGRVQAAKLEKKRDQLSLETSIFTRDRTHFKAWILN